MLEARALLAVTATLSGTTLEISLSEAGDAASLASDSTNYTVNGSGMKAPQTFAVGSVSAITVAGTAAVDGQSFTVDKGAAIASGLAVSSAVEATTVNGAINITSNASGNDVNVGSAAITLANDVTNINGSVIFGGAVTLAANVAVSSLFQTAFDKEVRFAGSVDGAYSLTTLNGQLNTFFDGDVGAKVPLASLTTSNQSAGGLITLQSVTTTGNQKYGENPTLQGVYTTSGGSFTVSRSTTLGGDTKVATAGGNVTLSGAVNGAKNLQIAAGAGAVTFSKAVGSIAPLASLRLASAGSVTASSSVKLDGSASGANPNGLVFAAGVNNITMKASGSVVKNYSGSGIVLGGSSGSTLSGFTSRDNGYAGLLATGTFASTVISGNTFRFNPSGVVLSAARGVVINGSNNISDNSVSGLGAYGDSTGTVVAGSVFTRNAIGIIVSAASNLEISSKGGTVNTITANTGYGVLATGDCSGTTISGTNVYSNPSGVVMNGAKGLAINGGTYLGSNTAAGLEVYGDSTGSVVAGTVITDNGTGIVLSGAQSLEVSSKGGTVNTIVANKNYGVLAAGDCNGTTISGSNIYSNPSGVVMSGAKGLAIKSGTYLGSNTAAGLEVYGDSSGSVVAGTVITDNGTGIILSGAKGLEISSKGGVANTIVANKSYGVLATGDCKGTTVAAATVYLNPIGIVLTGVQGLTVNGGNYVLMNSSTGLLAVGDCTDTRVSGNIFSSNAYGIVLDNAQHLLVDGLNYMGNYAAVASLDDVAVGMLAVGACTGTVVSGNVFSSNANGLVLNGAQGLVVNGSNSFQSNKSAGVVALGDCSTTVLANNVSALNENGLVLSAAQNLTVNGGNQIFQNKSFGLYATGASGGTNVTGNTIVDNGVNIDTSSAVGGTFQTS